MFHSFLYVYHRVVIPEFGDDFHLGILRPVSSEPFPAFDPSGVKTAGWKKTNNTIWIIWGLYGDYMEFIWD